MHALLSLLQECHLQSCLLQCCESHCSFQSLLTCLISQTSLLCKTSVEARSHQCNACSSMKLPIEPSLHIVSLSKTALQTAAQGQRSQTCLLHKDILLPSNHIFQRRMLHHSSQKMHFAIAQSHLFICTICASS